MVEWGPEFTVADTMVIFLDLTSAANVPVLEPDWDLAWFEVHDLVDREFCRLVCTGWSFPSPP